jgi:hypothetical protein
MIVAFVRSRTQSNTPTTVGTCDVKLYVGTGELLGALDWAAEVMTATGGEVEGTSAPGLVVGTTERLIDGANEPVREGEVGPGEVGTIEPEMIGAADGAVVGFLYGNAEGTKCWSKTRT